MRSTEFPASEHTQLLPGIQGNQDYIESGRIQCGHSQNASKTTKPDLAPLLTVNFMSFMSGVNEGSWSLLIPCLKSYYGISDHTVALIFPSYAAGYFVTACCNGAFVHYLGQRATMFLGALGFLAAFSAIMQGFSFPVTVAFMVVQGFGAALLTASENVYIAKLPNSTWLFSILHAVYGAGATVTPLVSTMILAHDLRWNFIYLFLSTVAFINICCMLVGFRNVKLDDKALQSSASNKISYKEAVFNRITMLGTIYIAIFVGIQLTFGSWGYIYLTEGRQGNEEIMGYVVTGFWGGMAIGRLFLGYLANRFGEKSLTSICNSMSLILVGQLWLSNDIVIVCIVFVVVGFLQAPVFTTAIALICKLLPRELHATALGCIAAGTSVGAAFFPFITGALSEIYGISTFPVVCFAMLAVMQCIWMILPDHRS
ncbi:major facilitator superfamily domain-containing protein [Radiomyces spectabilis]|uniref:major facilitator superfamily domain-containing protein n=1 Tax=Radiomyces spectabilis TaxID=64574 RepID=UPI00221E9CF9|nr:major facilitator superfamily domain-containing protein [Radiomyces spectabilis]KAI8377851.1 major facilitator superfamily domain-containing protein [Radiomyces spectabilis]